MERHSHRRLILMDLSRFERIWCAQVFLRDFVLIYPTYAIYMQQHGVDPLELGILFTIWSASSLLLEVPSGALADRYSRKTLLMISGVVGAAAFCFWALVPSFWGFALGFVVWSIGSSLVSGTSEAYLHDFLHNQGQAHAFERVYGRGEAAESIGTALALLLGGWLAEGGYFWPLVLSIAAPLLSMALIGFALSEPPRGDEQDEEQAGYFATLAAGVREAGHSKALRGVLIIFAMVVAAPYVLEEYLGVLLFDAEFSLTAVGIAFAGIWAARSFGLALAHRLAGWSLGRIVRGFAIGGVVLSLTAFVPALGAAFCLAIAFFISGAMEVLLQGHLQRAMDGSARATVTSVMSMVMEISAVALFLGVGIAQQH